jgi:hypothetical protein
MGSINKLINQTIKTTMEEITPNPDNIPLESDKLPELPEFKAPPEPKNGKRKFVVVAVLVVLFAAAGVASVYAYNRHKAPVKTVASNTVSSQHLTASDPYSGWKTYTSSFEKLSFKYPATWKSVTPAVPSSDPNADSFELESPSGNLTVSWDSVVDGIGGACSNTIMPGTAVSADSLGPCPYWTVLDTQKLTGADLYFADGIVTDDGVNYRPWCALQSPDGIIKSESNIGYLLFMGKNNDVVENGHDLGTQQAGLMCGRPFGGQSLNGSTTVTKLSKSEATAFLSTPEMQQAKLILLSAAYSQ